MGYCVGQPSNDCAISPKKCAFVDTVCTNAVVKNAAKKASSLAYVRC